MQFGVNVNVDKRGRATMCVGVGLCTQDRYLEMIDFIKKFWCLYMYVSLFVFVTLGILN